MRWNLEQQYYNSCRRSPTLHFFRSCAFVHSDQHGQSSGNCAEYGDVVWCGAVEWRYDRSNARPSESVGTNMQCRPTVPPTRNNKCQCLPRITTLTFGSNHLFLSRDRQTPGFFLWCWDMDYCWEVCYTTVLKSTPLIAASELCWNGCGLYMLTHPSEDVKYELEKWEL